MQRTNNKKIILIENKAGEMPLFDFKAYYEATGIKTCTWNQERSREQNQNSRNRSTCIWPTDF